MLKRILGLTIVLTIILSGSIFSQPESIEPNATSEESPSADTGSAETVPLPEVSSNPAVVIKRDPFEPVLSHMNLSESAFYTLEKYDVGQYTMIGIISDIPSPKVMFRAPDGRKYILKKGERIGRNGGVITQIERKQVVILERTKSYDGSINEKSIVLNSKNAL
jgi:type IV pilus assembly protein PilP